MRLKTNIEKVDKIIHVADLHIRLLKRHEEYEKVFENLYESIKSKKTENTIICLLGDIVHSKTDMTPELVSMTSNLFKNLAELCPTIIIPGNHDANLKNPHRLDAISPIVENIENENIFYIKNSGIYEFADLTFVHMSVFDEYKNYISAKDVNAKFKIALFHGTIDDSVNDFGFKLKNENMNKSFFEGYDLVLLGDIHKMQYFDERMAYCGSLLQQNHGESLENHGYILWNLNDKNSEFIEVKNDYGYFTLHIDQGIMPELNKLPDKCKLRIFFNDTTSEQEQIILSEIKEKINPVEITKNRQQAIKENSDTKSEDSIEIFSLQNVAYQNELIEKYLNRHFKLDNEIINKIKNINIDVNKSVINEEIVRNIRWKLNKFSWSNMFSYGENNEINFSELKGVVGLLGENAIGKTSVVDSISFCLYDKTSRESSPSTIMNNKKDNFDCNLEFELSNDVYNIERNCKKKKDNINIDYKADFKQIRNLEKSLNGKNRYGTNDNISNKIGTFDDFVLTSFSMQLKNANFIDIGHSKRKDLITQFIGANMFDKLLDESNEKYKELNNNAKFLQKEDYDLNIKNYNLQLSEKNDEYIILEKQENEHKLNINDIENKIDELSNKIINVDLKIDINEIIKNNKELYEEQNKLDENIEKSSKELEELQYDLNTKLSDLMLYHNIDIEKMNEELKELKEEKENFEDEKEKLEIVLKNKRDKLKKLGQLEYDPDCFYCMNNIFVKDAIKTKEEIKKDEDHSLDLISKIKSLEEIILSKNETEENYKKYKELKKQTDELNENIKDKFDYIQNKQSRKQFVINEIKINNSEIKKYKDSKAVIDQNNNIKTEITNLSKNKSDLEEKMKNVTSKKMTVYGQIQVIESNLKKNQEKKQEFINLLNELDCYKYYLQCIKRDGISHEIISDTMPKLELEINNVLSQIVDFTILINCDDKDINMYLSYGDDRIWPLEMASGMEKFISSIAIRTALTEISNLPRPNFLVLDEGFGVLDSDNLNSLSMLFDYLKTKFDFILIISHVDQLRDYVDIIIDIKKENGFSQIKYPI